MNSNVTTPKHRNTPRLRFPEFQGAWEEKPTKSFLKLSQITGSNGFDARKITVKLWGKGAIEKKESIKGSEQTKYYKRKAGQLIYSKLDFLNCAFAIIPQELDGFESTVDLPAFDFTGSISPEFALTRFVQRSFYEKFGSTADGSRKARRVHEDIFLDFQIALPTLPEQQKIAAFLTAVDAKIAAEQQRQALLQRYKKGVMQKLFTQTMRFTQDDGTPFPDWEEKRLGEVLKIGSGRDYQHLSKGSVPVYGTGGLMTYVDEWLYDGESVCIGRKGTIDKPQFLKGKFWTVDTLFYTHSYERVSAKFVLAIFQLINWKEHNEASGVPSLSKTTIKKIRVKIPHPTEQQKIADHLTALDTQITAATTHITTLQTFKKGLLQQLFV